MAKKNAEKTSAGARITKLRPMTALILGAVLALSGIILLSCTDGDRIADVRAAKSFIDACYIRADTNSNFNGYPVIVSGEPEWTPSTATDTLFNITADTACLFRVSEMCQWQRTGDSYELIWSEELISSEGFSSGHENPASYPLNTKSNYYTAVGVNVKGFALEDEIIVALPGKTALTKLPSPSAAMPDGYYTDGEYITNNKTASSPSVGDVRIHYEYITAETVTIAARQRETGLTRYIMDDDKSVYLLLSGTHGRADVMSELKALSASPTWILRISGVIAATLGMTLVFDGGAALTGYNPKLRYGKNKKLTAAPFAVIAAAGLAAGLLTSGIVFGARWAGIYPLIIIISLIITAAYLYLLISSIIKFTPRRVRAEPEYVSIIAKKNDKK